MKETIQEHISKDYMKTETNRQARLFIGAGKLDLREMDTSGNTFNVFLDRSYKFPALVQHPEQEMVKWFSGDMKCSLNNAVALDIFEFMDMFKFKFDYIEANRIFEHMEYCSGEIGRLLEACNVLTTKDSELHIIVPNSILLCRKLLDYEATNQSDIIEASKDRLIINTEFVNCKSDPHGSIWTPRLASEYIESEGTWKIVNIIDKIHYAQRDIYMKIICQKAIR